MHACSCHRLLLASAIDAAAHLVRGSKGSHPAPDLGNLVGQACRQHMLNARRACRPQTSRIKMGHKLALEELGRVEPGPGP